jgi:hypothetical protein
MESVAALSCGVKRWASRLQDLQLTSVSAISIGMKVVGTGFSRGQEQRLATLRSTDCKQQQLSIPPDRGCSRLWKGIAELCVGNRSESLG